MESSPANPILHGVVEVFERKEVAGWLDVDPQAEPIRVCLYINDEEIVGTWAIATDDLQGQGEIRRFRFALHAFWQFAKKSDQLSVRVAGRPLPIVKHGMTYHPEADGSESLETLRLRKAEGFVFGQKGALQMSKSVDKDWQQRILGLYQRVNAVLHEAFGYQAFFCYGTLLGAVRENGFIGHDMDFDCAYISDQPDGNAAKAELQRIAYALIEAGFTITPSWNLIKASDELCRNNIDIFHLYYDKEGQIAFPFGIAGTSSFTRADFGGLKEVDFLDHKVLVPQNAEALVEHMYGASWRTPNPGFSWDIHRTKRAREGILREQQKEEIYWANFYAHTTYDMHSTFCEFVLGQDSIPRVVLDLGCGDGRDSYGFAKSGRQVVGLDRSQIAVQHAKTKISQLPHGETAKFETCDVGDAEQVRDVIKRTRDLGGNGPMLFYARFFLHSIPEATQNTLMRTIGECSELGDYFAAEFRTDKDETARHSHGGHYRRFQSGAVFATRLVSEYGFDIQIRQEGNGFSPYKSEDPYLFRVIATRSDR